jgi:hypothetical protein
MSKTSLYTSAAHAVVAPNSCEEYRCQRTHFPIYGKMYHSREGLNFPKNVPETPKLAFAFFMHSSCLLPVQVSCTIQKSVVLEVTQPLYMRPKKNQKCQKYTKNGKKSKKHKKMEKNPKNTKKWEFHPRSLYI